jgi:hypothetical protein
VFLSKPAALVALVARHEDDEGHVGQDQEEHGDEVKHRQSLMREMAASSQSIQKAATSRVTLRRAGSRMKRDTASQTWEA